LRTDFPCAARRGVVRRNSLRSLRELRSNRAPQVRGTKRASRADPAAALLGAADIAQPGAARRTPPSQRGGPNRPGRPRFGPPPPAATATPEPLVPQSGTLAAKA